MVGTWGPEHDGDPLSLPLELPMTDLVSHRHQQVPEGEAPEPPESPDDDRQGRVIVIDLA